MERRLRESEERYRSLFDRMLDGVYRSTHEGRFVDVNPAFVRMFGYSSREEMLEISDIGRALYFSGEERGTHIPESAERGVEVFPMRRKDGSMIWVEDHGGYVHDEHGKVIFHEGILRDVTERRRAEELLRTSETKYRCLFEKIPHAIYQVSPDGKPLTVNPAFTKLLGYNSENELTAIDVERDLYVNPDDRKTWRRDMQVNGEVRDVELLLKRKNGEKIIVLDNAHIVRDREGMIQYYEGTLTDITERKQMEDRLRLLHEHALKLESAKELKQIVKFTLDAMEFMLGFEHADFWMVRERSICVQGSRGNPFQLTELRVGGLGVIVKAAALKNTIRISDTRREPTFIDDPFRNTNGEFLHTLSELAVPILVGNESAGVLNVESIGINAFNEQDQMLLEMLASHVASALNRLKYQDELRHYSEHLEELVEERTRKLGESEARFREMADLLPQIVYEIDERGNFTFVNHSGIASSGYTEADLRAGINALQVFSEQDRDRARENLQKVLSGQEIGPVEYTAQRKDGSTFPVMIHATPIIHGSKPAGLRGIAVDITERKEMEMRLLKAEHLAGIGETASMVAHDLRNPLQGISAATYLLRSEALTTGERDEMLRLIEDNVEYSDGIVKDLLDYSRTFDLMPSDTTPNKIITSALQVAKVPDRIRVRNLTLEEPIITVDPDRMKRVFVNLVENAVDAMPNEGTLTICTKESNGFVEILFSDTGAGMPKEVMENLWKPLQTTKAKGMGMGLAIVKRIVDAHGGKVSLENRTGGGTTISIQLPIIKALRNA